MSALKRALESNRLIGELPELPDDISQYGVLGMRWGVRRQPDGGKARTGSSQDQTSGYEPKNPGIGQGGEPPKIGSGSRSPSTQRKKAKAMSDQELRSEINRLQMEQQFVNLTSKKSTLQKGQKVATDILANSAKNIAQQSLIKYGSQMLDNAIKSQMKK